ncbi:MAG: hypothetical protein A2Z99_00290 [Treponema sp. GWB1_62_6]|nr:MAG: hypothetical protein A2001_09010 [Treponema sp. GWC1_61_84]OHE70959.1 MAG: hypothetical protein A2Z99_00290 [Treponema sp. GWB1_62_6]HCM25396.1 hypothetical protein [Treponema sp.]
MKGPGPASAEPSVPPHPAKTSRPRTVSGAVASSADPAVPLKKTGKSPRDVSGFSFVRKVVRTEDVRAKSAATPAATPAARLAVPLAVPLSVPLAATLGLPPDALSEALLRFVRAFSLPLDVDRLLRFRRSFPGLRSRPEALALAAVTAWDKGILLSPSALDEVAGLMAADDESSRGKGEEEEPERRNPRHAGAGSVPELRGVFESSLAAGDALSAFNALPGRNGARWLIFPFSAASGASEFKAVARVLLYTDESTVKTRMDRFALDVSSRDRRWLIFSRGPLVDGSTVFVSADPPLGCEAPRIAGVLERAFAAFGSRISASSEVPAAAFGEWEDGEYVRVDEEA